MAERQSISSFMFFKVWGFWICYILFKYNQIYSFFLKSNSHYLKESLFDQHADSFKLIPNKTGKREGEVNWRGMWCYLRVRQICHRLFLVILSLWIPLKACQREAISTHMNTVATLTFYSSLTSYSQIHTKGSTLLYSNYKCYSILCNNHIHVIKTKKLIITYAFWLCQLHS